MDDSTIDKEYKEIINLLDERKLKEALKRLERFMTDMPEWEIRADLENIQTSYRYMLQYMQQGVKDPERNNLYRKLLVTVYNLADKVHIAGLTPVSTHYYFERRRYYRLIPLRKLSILQMELESYTEDMAVGRLLTENNAQEDNLNTVRKRHESTLSELFYLLWLSDKWTEENEQQAHDFLNSVLIQTNDLSLFISALTLSLTEHFDIRKFMLLFDAYQHSANEVNQRAIVGIALVTFLYDNRLELYPEVAARLSMLNENVIFASNLSRVQVQLLRCRETEKINKKMREEIIPEMMKNVTRMNPKMGEESDEDNNPDDKNPDWEDWMEQSGMSDKLKEMSELQMEGADVYMSTFAQLKTYPFFREMANWFYPFDTQHSAIVQTFATTTPKRNILLDSIFQSGFFCNSDKYSFCFTIMQIPEAQREMMSRQFESQNSAMDESKRYDKIIAYSQQTETISNQYIHDLYRFFKIYPRRHEFLDVFQESLNLQYCKTFKETLSDTNNMHTLAGYFFHKNYLIEAFLLYEDIAKEVTNDPELYQKMGYCLQKNKNYEGAIGAYRQADILKPDNVWTNRHLATCYRQSGQNEKALEYYKKVEAAQPENLTVLSQTGHCLADLKRYEEALHYFFKVEYLNSDSPKAAWRAIAWCSFVIGKHEQAMKYYDKLREKDIQAQDYLNAGHVSWALGDIGKATRMYSTCVAMSESWESFLLQFGKDREDLLAQGIKEEDIPLMLDLLKYNSENI